MSASEQPLDPNQPSTPPEYLVQPDASTTHPAQPAEIYPPLSYPAQPYPPDAAPASPYPPTAYPSQPYPSAGFPAQPSQPYPPAGFPAEAYPPQPWPTGPGEAMDAPAQPAAQGLAAPLPAWVLIVGWVVVLLALGSVFAFGSDWAAGAQHVGIATGALALLVIAALIVRGVRGLFAATNVRRTAQVIGASVSAALLLLVSAGGIGLQMPIHHVQASVLEGQQQWQNALNEYSQGGATAPNSEDLARTYNKWGEALNTSGQYQAAITKFEFVVTTFTGAPIGVARANKDDATAYYNLAEKDLNASDYQGAVTAFQTLTIRFSSAPEVAKAHADYAKALLEVGQAQIASQQCDTAVTTYTLLQQQFGDTPSGSQATTALSAPQPVTGKFTGKVAPPAGQIAVAVLGTGVNLATHTGKIVTAALIQANGSFSFPPVAVGTYDFLLGFIDTATNKATGLFVFEDANNQPITYDVHPLCPTDIGALNVNVENPPNALLGRNLLSISSFLTTWDRLNRKGPQVK